MAAAHKPVLVPLLVVLLAVPVAAAMAVAVRAAEGVLAAATSVQRCTMAQMVRAVIPEIREPMVRAAALAPAAVEAAVAVAEKAHPMRVKAAPVVLVVMVAMAVPESFLSS